MKGILLNKKIIALLVAFVMGISICTPKAHADAISNVLCYSGGGMVGTGIVLAVFCEGDWKWWSVPFFAVGGGLILWGILDANSKGDLFAKFEKDPVMKHVSLDVAPAGLCVGGHFSW